MKVAFQEQTIGRHKLSGAPLGMKDEFDAARSRRDRQGRQPGHSRERACPACQRREQRRRARSCGAAYSYNDGVNFTAERWPPWRQGMEYDAGLFFICYQRDPRTGFIKIFEKMSKFDMMNQFVTHVGGGLFACPGGVGEGEFIGQRLFASA